MELALTPIQQQQQVRGWKEQWLATHFHLSRACLLLLLLLRISEDDAELFEWPYWHSRRESDGHDWLDRRSFSSRDAI